jgi:hypothetical protein
MDAGVENVGRQKERGERGKRRTAPCLIPSFFTLSPSYQFLAACIEY